MKNIDLQYISQKPLLVLSICFIPRNGDKHFEEAETVGNSTYSKVLFFDIKASSQSQLSEQAYRSYLSLIWTFVSPPSVRLWCWDW